MNGPKTGESSEEAHERGSYQKVKRVCLLRLERVYILVRRQILMVACSCVKHTNWIPDPSTKSNT